MKRKQKDFQKVKLKVGKKLPKGLNETNTSFQTRKINLNQQIKDNDDGPSLQELLSYMKSTDAKIKFDNMRRLFKYISNNRATLHFFFSDILKDLGRTLLESDPKVRSEAILILGLCIENMTDQQFSPFVVPLTTYLNCMMTHINFHVKQDSLKFLNILLKTHCLIICQSQEILFGLLDLISCKERRNNSNKRKLIDFVSTKINTDEWRMHVLEQVLFFMSAILKKGSTAMDTVHARMIFWDAQEPLHLPLYLNSGAMPAQLDDSLYAVIGEVSNFEKLKGFMDQLIFLFLGILKSFDLHRSFSESTLKYLNVVIENVCYLAQWIVNLNLEKDAEQAKLLKNVSCELFRKFPFAQRAGSVPRGEESAYLSLNLGICCLYGTCSSLNVTSTRYADCWSRIRAYIPEACKAGGALLDEKSVSYLVKICRAAIKCSILDQEDFVGTMKAALRGLVAALKARKISHSANEVYSFFMEITMESDIQGINEYGPIKEWYSILPNLLFSMLDTNGFVPNFLSYLRQLCGRKIVPFLNAAGRIPFDRFIELLKHANEEVQFTAIRIIASMTLSPHYMQEIAEVIRDECFSLNTSFKLIRCLHTRFSIERDLTKQMEFVKFLLNLGCDTFLITDATLDAEPMPLSDMLIDYQQSFSCRCEIYPTYNFKFHYEIFKECAECLSTYFRCEDHIKAVIVFIRTIFDEQPRFPLHSAIAIVELFKRFPILNSDEESADFLQNIIYSFLLYTSLLTDDVPEAHWPEYNVAAVNDCFDIVNTLDIIEYMSNAVHTFKSTQIYHVLRTLMYLFRRGCFLLVQKDSLFVLLQKLSEHEAVCADLQFKSMIHNLCDYIASS